jgi:hypothetical protein
MRPSVSGVASVASRTRLNSQETYKVYRQCYRTTLDQAFADKSEEMVKQFKRQYCLGGEVSIAFMGVWDTVDAVGLPFHLGDFINLVFYRFKFPDYHLNASVKRACHALALDDERHSFHPLLWKEQPGGAERIEQVWFAGAHSNVGGGYTKQGMSLVTLDWMIQIAGLGIFYRWKPRDMGAMCRENRVQPAIHLSAWSSVRACEEASDFTWASHTPGRRFFGGVRAGTVGRPSHERGLLTVLA